jgi:UDP-glucose 4-epimerase
MRLAGKRVLLTGGAGFIGSHIADQVLRDGADEIVVLDDLSRGRRENLALAERSGRLRLVVGDMRDRALLNTLVAGSDIVFHQAALRITQCAAEPRHAFEVMAEATFDLLEACVTHGVDKVIVASSASIYGQAPEFPTRESAAPYDDRTLYGGLKLLGESLLRAMNDTSGLNYCALRYFNVIGPRMDRHGRYTEVLVRWLERLDRGLPPLIFGDGLQTMDFVDVRDVARANIAAALAPGINGAFNIASGREVSLLALAEALADAAGRPGMTPLHEAPRAVNPVARRLADVSAARDRLGFTASFGLRDTLRDLLAWWRDAQAGAAEGAAG